MARKLLAAILLSGLLAVTSMPMNLAFADAVSGQLFYTTFTATPNRVYSIDYTYDGVANFQVMNDLAICGNIGADGISQNPQNPDLLLVGGQGALIHTCSKSTGTTVATASGGPQIYHLEVPDATSVYGNSIPGQPVYFTINPTGTVNPGTPVAMAGSDTVLTQIMDTPVGFFYASNDRFGTISFTNPTTATTTRLYGPATVAGPVPGNGAHGGVYDPFSNTIITFGGSTVNQWDMTGALLNTKSFPGAGFDQGTVDGKGHLFIASNPNLFFLDYSSDMQINTATHFNTLVFVKSTLDDVAPLVGQGSTEPGDAIGGEILSIDSASLLLAGLQTNVSWVIPVLLSVAGIGLVIVKRK